MAVAVAVLKAVAAAFTVAPWLRYVALSLAMFGFGFVKGCNTGRSWAKEPEPAKVVRPERKPILPWREAEVPSLPAKIEAVTVPQVDHVVEANKMVTPVQSAGGCANGQCSTFTRRRWFR